MEIIKAIATSAYEFDSRNVKKIKKEQAFELVKNMINEKPLTVRDKIDLYRFFNPNKHVAQVKTPLHWVHQFTTKDSCRAPMDMVLHDKDGKLVGTDGRSIGLMDCDAGDADKYFNRVGDEVESDCNYPNWKMVVQDQENYSKVEIQEEFMINEQYLAIIFTYGDRRFGVAVNPDYIKKVRALKGMDMDLWINTLEMNESKTGCLASSPLHFYGDFDGLKSQVVIMPMRGDIVNQIKDSL
tara:strand:- start:536 stop:1255 length:720 start_codon:yes stop_codon:yes gene_type:complete